ncbi:MAG TPA: M6 family metalloprotease domain-containing protein, partial [Candidatus Marinimicrobia bacterium]|nr:M6 family metalloprotease domain-containing protein [Candidatus Neomarinimicrobiota bacterium]
MFLPGKPYWNSWAGSWLMNTLFNLVLSFYFLLTPLYSVSAPPFPFEVEQLDGSKIPVRMFGHEYYNWMETEDGYVVDWVEDDNRLGWYYSELNDEGKFSPTHILVEYPVPDNVNIPRKLKESNPHVRKITHGDRQSGNFHNSNLQRSTEASLIQPLVFLVDFVNLPSGMPNSIYSKEQFQQLLFESGLESDGSTLPPIYDMSVRDYFNEISNGNMDIYGDSESIVDWTTVSQDYSYYVDGEQGTGSGIHGIARSAAALVVEIAMEVEIDLDFSNFDGDEDGAVDVVILIVEGWGDGDNDQFWPHMSLIHAGSSGIGSVDPNAPTNDDGYFSLDGVAIKKYIVITEQFHMNYFGVGKYDIHPIGTICHEMGHVLGLPDLYDTSVNSAAGIGEWGLMGSGNWQRPISPAYMSAWSRYRLGFIEPSIYENVPNLDISLYPAEDLDEVAYILPIDSNLPQEYLILENRQQLGADQYLEKS